MAQAGRTNGVDRFMKLSPENHTAALECGPRTTPARRCGKEQKY
jgi:hypothetical protein